MAAGDTGAGPVAWLAEPWEALRVRRGGAACGVSGASGRCAAEPSVTLRARRTGRSPACLLYTS
uniref:hypothetical protein n=1 Tax=Streptomyces sp. rh45 TaxID=3028726 RepID=UPI003C7B8438